MPFHDIESLPDVQTYEEFIGYLSAQSDDYCADMIRLYLIESEGYSVQYGADAGKVVSLKRKLKMVLDFGFCYTNEAFRTGWIERDGTCRSNDYGCHDSHIYSINQTPGNVERMGWLHVSTHMCTPYFTPSAAQVREMKRIGKWYNENRILNRWKPIKAGIPVDQQLGDLTADVNL